MKEYIPLRSIEDFEEFIVDSFGNFELETYIENPYMSYSDIYISDRVLNISDRDIYYINFWGEEDYVRISYGRESIEVKNEEFFNTLYSMRFYENKTFKELFYLLKDPYTYYFSE